MGRVIWVTLLVVLAYTLMCCSAGHTADEWRSRTIYQLLTDRFATQGSQTSCSDLSSYCGGTWKALRDRLDYITNMGFDAIWITPVVDNTPGGYHGYWQQDMYKVNENFGTDDDLKDLVAECHRRGVWVMVDVVVNHVGCKESDCEEYAHDTDFSYVNPFNKAEHYHSYCEINDWNDDHEVEYCRLSGMPDLDQEGNSWVRSELKKWASQLITTYDFDGMRLDTVPEVPVDFWKEFQEEVGVYTLGEVYNGDVNYVARYEGAIDATLSYPLFFTLRGALAGSDSMYKIESMMKSYQDTFERMDLMGTFIDNHDQKRFLNQNFDYERYKNALTFVLLGVGVPVVYYGTEQGYAGADDPGNRESLWPNYDENHELYKFIKTLIGFRKSVDLYKEEQIQRYVDDNFYAFTRGQTFAATTNAGKGASDVTKTITYHDYPDGTQLCNALNSNDCVTVQDGKFDVTLTGGSPKVYSPTSTMWHGLRAQRP